MHAQRPPISEEALVAIQEKMAETAKSLLLSNGSVRPVAVLIRGGECALVPLRFSDDRQMHRLRDTIRHTILSEDTEAAIFIAEAYTLRTEDFRRDGIRPRFHPEREEAIVIAAAMPGFTTAIRIPFSTTMDHGIVFDGSVEHVGGNGETFWTEDLFQDRPERHAPAAPAATEAT